MLLRAHGQSQWLSAQPPQLPIASRRRGYSGLIDDPPLSLLVLALHEHGNGLQTGKHNVLAAGPAKTLWNQAHLSCPCFGKVEREGAQLARVPLAPPYASLLLVLASALHCSSHISAVALLPLWLPLLPVLAVEKTTVFSCRTEARPTLACYWPCPCPSILVPRSTLLVDGHRKQSRWKILGCNVLHLHIPSRLHTHWLRCRCRHHSRRKSLS
mmetsp:Transcript_96365/g.171276  ORF Transcript_96365/g.171276 Transcript_96365/m.171276 type:complete len:213 (+) Transcript_96365:280-918(+)